MKHILVIITLTFLNANILPPENTTIPPDAKNLQNVYAGDRTVIGYGAKIYKKQCWLCHGNNGKGDGPGAEELNTKPADFNSEQVLNRTDGELFWWISKGGNDMQPFENTLTEDEIWKVVNYIRKTQNKI